MRTPTRLVFAAAPPVVAAALGGLAARDAAQVYRRLDTPRWAPPSEVFGPVWSVLYTLNGVAGWRLTRRPHRAAMALHLTQLVLNTSWTPLFFATERRRAALAVNLALDVAAAAEVAVLAPRDRVAAAALLPYLAWSTFATVLTTAIVSRES